jgi:hypothetical protein
LIRPKIRIGAFENAENVSGENRDEPEIHIPNEDQ